nr:MAG TPA: hypothetical protein [Caudoviricetes sp.]
MCLKFLARVFDDFIDAKPKTSVNNAFVRL